jgi:hypothetical protein
MLLLTPPFEGVPGERRILHNGEASLKHLIGHAAIPLLPSLSQYPCCEIGSPSRQAPPAFPPWQTVYGYFRTFLDAGVWETIRHYLVTTLRETEGREASPTAIIIDTQSVKTTEKEAMGRATRSEAPSLP